MKSIAYTAMDVHQDWVVVALFGESGNEPILEKRLENDRVKVRKFFAKWSEVYDLRCCYEASSCGYVMHRWLKEMGISCDVVAPSLIPRRPGDRVKTDRRDALKLARLYRAGELVSVRVPNEAEESVRGLIRCRETMLREVKRSRHYVLKFLSLHGLSWKEGTNWTQKHWQYVRSRSFEGPDATVWREYLTLLDYKLTRLEDLDRQIEEIAFSDVYKEAVGYLRCFRGIDTQTAMVVITEMVDFHRFASPGKAASYVGLVPGRDQSGESNRNCGITKSGNSRCRRALIEAAWHYIHQPALGKNLKKRQVGQPPEVIAHSWKAQHRLHKKFWSLACRGDRRTAVTAVSRELIGFIWAVMTHSYEPGVAKAA